MNREIENIEKSISEKEELNNKLVKANSSLLQQVGVPYNTPKNTSKGTKDPDEEEKISWNDCFDKKGNFLK